MEHRLARLAALPRWGVVVAITILISVLTPTLAVRADVDAELFPAPARNAITFWGHSCTYIDIDGFGIVTDPVFESYLLLRWRKVGEPPPSSYAGTRVILISHAHPDHLSAGTIAKFPDEVIVLCPEPDAEYLEGLPQTVQVMRLGDTFAIPGGEITAVAAKHMGGRFAVTAETDGRALGYVIRSAKKTVYYSGDTSPFEGFDQVGLKHRPDIALLNINGHLHDTDAVFAARATRAPMVVPLHYGAYGYLFLPRIKKARDHHVLERLLAETLVTLDLGESLSLERAKR